MENSKYEKEIAALRLKRDENRERFFALTKETEKAMQVFRGEVCTEHMITVDDLKEFKLFEIIVVSDKVSFVKYYQDDVKMCFKSYMKPAGRYGLHKHNCKEITKVVKGHLIELHQEHKIYEAGQTVIYDKEVVHEPYCTVESEYDVTFII
jgi:hypothetical protein